MRTIYLLSSIGHLLTENDLNSSLKLTARPDHYFLKAHRAKRLSVLSPVEPSCQYSALQVKFSATFGLPAPT
jgi:hypothetical protein